jgi:hypothetical protein
MAKTVIAAVLKAVIGTVLWMLVGIIVGSFLLDYGLPTVGKMERTESAVKANAEQKPPAPTNNIAPIYPPVTPPPPDRNPGEWDGLTTVIHPVIRYCSWYETVVPCSGTEYRVVSSTE